MIRKGIIVLGDNARRYFSTGEGLYRVRLGDAEKLKAAGQPADVARKYAGLAVILNRVNGYYIQREDLRPFGFPLLSSMQKEALEVEMGARAYAANSDCGAYKAFDVYSGGYIAGGNFDAEAGYCTCGEKLKTAAEKKAGLCARCAKERAATLFAYHGRPDRSSPRFSKPMQRAEVLHLGAEIEIGGGDGMDRADFCATVAAAGDVFSPFCYFEQDSSIEEGVECITRPCTLADFEKDKTLAAIYDNAEAFGGEFNYVNGLHFHIDNMFLGRGSAEKIAAAQIRLETMVYKYFNIWRRISGRRADAFGYSTKKDVSGIIDAALHHNEKDHFDAVNCGGATTTEIRFFGGRISTREDFLAVADIVAALATWAANADERQTVTARPAAIVRYIKNAARVYDWIRKTDRLEDVATLRDEQGRRDFNDFRARLQTKATKKGGKA